MQVYATCIKNDGAILPNIVLHATMLDCNPGLQSGYYGIGE